MAVVQEAGAAVKRRNHEKYLSRWMHPYSKNFDIFLLFIPVILFYLIFHYAPMYGALIAFKDYKIMKGFSGSEWIGFRNFIDLFNTPSFWEVFRNTIIISCLRLLFGFPAPIILAILLNEITNSVYKKLIQTISYLPHFLSWVVLAGIFTQFLSPSTGLVNQVITMFGGKPVFFMGAPDWFRFTLITTGLWQSIGWGSIIYLASIASINVEMYEAAVVDGANRLQQIMYITLPSLVPVITITLILSMGSIINAGFDQIFNMYNPNVYRVADIIDTYVYRKGLAGMEYSFASAVGLFKNIIAISLIFTTNAVAKRVNEYGIW